MLIYYINNFSPLFSSKNTGKTFLGKTFFTSENASKSITKKVTH